MTTDPASTMRAALATAISERDTAKEALRIASESAERANELLQAAKVKLAAFGDVDHEILQHRAASFKAAVQRTIPKATLELPEELICRERARDTVSARRYDGLPELNYPFHDRDVIVTACGRLCLHRKRINLSTVLAGQKLGIKEVDDGIWLVSFMHYDLGNFDLEQKTLQPLDNPFGTRLSPMS
jgi:hypothetical protein